MADDPVLSQGFSARDLIQMKNGNAPPAAISQQLGGQRTYQLHHTTPINQGGGVYDIDNITIVIPRFHKEILDPSIHYGR